MTIDDLYNEIFKERNESDLLNPNDYVYFYISKETFNKPQYEEIMYHALKTVGTLMLVIENETGKYAGRSTISDWQQYLHLKETFFKELYKKSNKENIQNIV